MSRRRLNRFSFASRIAEEKKRLEVKAAALSPSAEKDALLEKIQKLEMASGDQA